MNEYQHPILGSTVGRLVKLSSLALLATSSTVYLYSQTLSDDVEGSLEDLVTYGGEDPNFVLPNQPIEGVLGFSKSILETPRSATVVSSEMISDLSISEVSDLSRIAPSTNTVTRWGVQGNIDIRAMTADTYFRGMKRIEPQGNSRTVLGANDQIEVVRGPAPAYFGSGKIGGYTNMTPKSGRSRQGAYLEDDEGFVQMIFGSYSKQEVSLGMGGPINFTGNSDRRGGYYIYALSEDSDSYYKNIPIGQKILQGAISQELTDKWRVEAGFNLQETRSAGGFLTRLTQDLIDNGDYWGGTFLVDLDLDNSGKIGHMEMEQASPVIIGNTSSSGNNALRQRFDSRYQDALAGPVPTVANENSALDALQTMRPEFAALLSDDNMKLLNVLPQGFVMDPDTVELTKIDYSHVSLEKELLAKLGLFYLDFVNDGGDVKMKNQILFDTQDQFKDSELPFYQKQDIWVVEDKFSVETELINSERFTVNSISAVSFRHTNAQRHSNSGDYDNRPNLALPQNERTPKDLFITPRENSDYYNGGAPYTNWRHSKYDEFGLGSMLDIAIGDKTNIILGARYDTISMETTDYADLVSEGGEGIYIFGSGADGVDPRFRTADNTQTGSDDGFSYTGSFFYRLPANLNVYYTYGIQTALADSSDLTLPRNLVEGGPYAEAKIEEVGIKGSHLDGKLYWALAGYKQSRNTVNEDPNGNPLLGSLGLLSGEGIELEVRWVPSEKFYLSAFSVTQKTVDLSNDGGWLRLHGETHGFEDVLDPETGEVIFPAQAFTWGGQAAHRVEPGEKIEMPAYPNTSHGIAMGYKAPYGLSLTLSGNYISEVQSGRYGVIMLPEATTANLAIGWKKESFSAKLDIFNLTDELYYTGRSGSTSGDELISVKPPRRWQITVSKEF
ncbi:TonB-dependent receptor plug domain-containing protein [Pelagicoccus sp. SDUM812003]|uniref:TonB-dependent receptor plug domain-containing protein n=1 Tax=Pelagicoccus sp. SDUM812003 TaxID=3041267 RepID=UPI00280DCCE2|nr:TonB-dependent receptor plug domain-containing protein [Pelagicoccus sp. SDUM812003]MDQ8204691.1 TonB-dependent receptor plug domain-containing protein [Pelagicoccus sp. SDUM812003]